MFSMIENNTCLNFQQSKYQKILIRQIISNKEMKAIKNYNNK